MPPEPTSPSQSIATPTSAGKSLLSKGLAKITSPFATKSRNFTDFYIELDEPHRQYSPGDSVKGSVLLTVAKAVRVTHTVVCLHGYAQVFRNPSSPGNTTERDYLEPASGKKRSQYFGNGFAALFKDEVVLCGEGRLGEGIYKFNFELVFPGRGLPSSIDFERGTISYMVTSTVTRPTAISPKTTCERKIYLIENIDVASLKIPKPLVVSLEVVSRRYKVRSATKMTKGVKEDQTQAEESIFPSGNRVRTEEAIIPNGGTDCPQSPGASEISSDGILSTSTVASAADSPTVSVRAAGGGAANASKPALPLETITARIELFKGGYLRGDSITVLLTVKHIKPIRSMHGVITTLYRQARVDMRPALPIGEAGKGDKPKYEDYYAKSKTGLGGLSLSDAGSSHVFRKDLSQSFTPLLIDPRTLCVEVKATVRVPDGAFPTISTVPGAMIDFKYYVEVIVDLQGKLAALDGSLPSVGMVNMNPASGSSSGGQRAEEAGPSVLAAWDGSIVNTDQMRRDKNIVTQRFEVTVGTRDSSRRRGKQKEGTAQNANLAPHAEATPHDDDGYRGALFDAPGNDLHYGRNWEPNLQYRYQTYREQQSDELYRPATPDAPPLIPFPDMTSEDGLDEKTRARRAEERLYPSQPPLGDAEESSSKHAHSPSAPDLQDELGGHFDGASSFTGPSSARSAMRPSAPVISEMHPPALIEGLRSPAPAYHDAAGRNGPAITEDKQELQRQRLQMEASAPLAPDDEYMIDAEDGAVSAPSAPAEASVASSSLEDIHDNDYSSHDAGPGASSHPSENLPRYHR